ncbi:peptidylprolyl isomerase [Candidatus Methylobacter oryzae]|uniref:peptidylprolyl isomerase n=1 Tax=Candidatus Methylobacter oryzae TaxID=2497749 RepID=A0ABY3C525_9GAMM|nr:peptidylprolyl isomerase [Candidatus Methylobacter oryzae]TRW89926.1 peptidylprolyl isomerase [Candidatus Methylobacter oryzae]
MKKFIPLLVVGTALIAGCNQEKATDTTSSSPAATATPTVDKADAVAEVNGQYIPKSALETLEKEIAERSHGQTFPKEKLVEELVQRELLIQDAKQKQLDKSPEFIAQLEAAKKALLTQADLQNFIKANPVTDAEVKAEYDSKVAAEKGTEFKARHILVKTEAEAKKLIAELDKGADFAKLANKNSLDAKESQNGGDLGWFSPAQMVAPFSEAVAALENGKYTKEPVKTQFGYHVILREESRPVTPPPLEAVKEQLTPFLQRKKVQEMIETLRKQAKVEVLVPLTEEPPKAAPAAEPAAPATEAAPTTQAPAAAEPAKAAEGAATEKAPATAEEKPAAPAAAEPAKTEEPAKAAEPAPAAPAETKK